MVSSATETRGGPAGGGPADGITVTVCGGGNAAHVAAAMYSHNGATVNLFLSLDKEVASWRDAQAGGIQLHKKQDGSQYTGHVHTVSNNARDVIPQSDLIILIVPAFAHRPIMEAIGPHLQRGAMVVAIPSPGGFDWMARHVLGPMADEVVVAGTVCLPWVCRLDNYARHVELMGEKSPVTLVARPAAGAQRLLPLLNALHDNSRFVAGQVYVQATLFPTNPMLHPGIMYARWHCWDGAPLAERPVFYEGVGDEAAAVLEGEDDDIQAVRRALEAELGVDVPLPTLIAQMVEGYGPQITDPSTYKSMLQTNTALQGLFHPMKETADGHWLPDFSSRYLTEDVPYGLCAIKGTADLMGVPTPTIDKVLSWAQGKLGKEYLVDGHMTGRDVGTASCPQAHGIASKAELLRELCFQLGGQGAGGAEQKLGAPGGVPVAAPREA